MAYTIFTYENVKNNKEIRDQWRNYLLQKFNDKPSWPLLTQILGDSSTLQIDKLTPESFDTINKIFGAPAIYNDRPIDTTPLRPPLMQKSAQQTPDKNNDAIPNNQKDSMPVVGISNEGTKSQHVSVEPATQNDKTGKPVVVTGGQPSNGNPSKKTIGWSSGNGYMYEDDHPNNWRTSYGNSGKIKDRDTYTRGSIPGSMGLSYTEPSQVQMTRNDAVPETFSDSDWNAAHGISYVTGKDGLIYRIDPQHPNGYVDPFKNDLSKTGSIGYATGKGMLTSSSDGFYSSQKGMQSPMPVSDNWKFREAWKDPMAIIGQFGRGAFTDNEYNQLVNHAVNDLGYNKNVFSGSRFG